MIISLKGKWTINNQDIKDLEVTIPGSVISALIENKIIDNPYFGNNEELARSYLKQDYIFKKEFHLDKKQLRQFNYLFLDRVDTIAEIVLNGKTIAKRQDFHVFSKILLDNALLKTDNILKIKFTSNYKYIDQYDDQGLFKTYSETEPKSVVIRKPNFMFGWDWAPNLADMGIVGDVYILSTNEGYLDSYRYEYNFINEHQLEINIHTEYVKHKDGYIKVSLLYKDKLIAESQNKLEKENSFSFIIDNPVLWFPNGLRKQALYDLDISTGENEYHYKIGFKKISFDFEKVDNGRHFAISCNGVDLFLKGYNFVPEDNILPYISNERTDEILKLAHSTGANVIRVWGGGYYPNDFFYQRCDELGLLIWQDLMFADAAYNYEDKQFLSLIKEEVTQQIKRIRNHPSILLICGNNENETALNGHEEIFKEHFIKMFCQDIKQIINSHTNLLYLHSSPTNLDPIFNRPNDPNIFDVHYWEIGNGNEDYKMYSTIYPPMLSEFGIWSMPCYQTLSKFISKDELYLYSPELKSRNKRDGNFERIDAWLNRYFKKPDDFQSYIYLTQIYQARAVKYCVEHLRRNMDRCHGAIYWQLNDSWPGISCSLIDYEYNLKALYYYVKRFFQNVIVNITNQNNQTSVYISNLENKEIKCVLTYKHMRFNGDVIKEETISTIVEPIHSGCYLNIESSLENADEFIYVELKDDSNHLISSDIYQQEVDKNIQYPKATFEIKKVSPKSFIIKANEFSKDIYISAPQNVRFSDNYFTLLKGQEILITSNEEIESTDISVMCINNL